VAGGGPDLYPEQVFDGIENAPRALIDLLAGRTMGKVIVRLAPDERMTG
jgi:NADPH-dependent curcumin reductase CurA